MRSSRWVAVALAILMLAACKIRIIVPEGGSVETQSGAYSCASGKRCNIDVLDFYFDQTFIAKPANGYTFKFWKSGDRRFCGNDSNPCHLMTTIFTGAWVPVVQPFLENPNEIFYLKPVFEPLKDADLWFGLYDDWYSFRWCDREGRIGYEFGIRNLGPAVAKNVVFTFEEELFIVPTGWGKREICVSQFGKMSCSLGDLAVALPENNWDGEVDFVFRSGWFVNKKTRQHRVKFTVSSDSEDPNLSNNITYWTQTIPPFPKNQALCDFPY